MVCRRNDSSLDCSQVFTDGSGGVAHACLEHFRAPFNPALEHGHRSGPEFGARAKKRVVENWTEDVCSLLRAGPLWVAAGPKAEALKNGRDLFRDRLVVPGPLYKVMCDGVCDLDDWVKHAALVQRGYWGLRS